MGPIFIDPDIQNDAEVVLCGLTGLYSKSYDMLSVDSSAERYVVISARSSSASGVRAIMADIAVPKRHWDNFVRLAIVHLTEGEFLSLMADFKDAQERKLKRGAPLGVDTCPECGGAVDLRPTQSSFYAQCPHCGQQVYVGP